MDASALSHPQIEAVETTLLESTENMSEDISKNIHEVDMALSSR